MVDALAEAASDSECDVETSVERLFQGYRLPRTAPAVEVAAAALRDCDIEPVLHQHRRRQRRQRVHRRRPAVVNLANGTERNHQPDESVTVEALETMLDVTLALVSQAPRVAAQGRLDD